MGTALIRGGYWSAMQRSHVHGWLLVRHGDTHDDDLLVICSLRRQAKVTGGLIVSHEDSTDEGWVLD